MVHRVKRHCDAALFKAVRHNDAKAARIAIADGARIDSVDRIGQSLVMQACASGYAEVLGVLIDAGANLRHADRLGRTAAFFCAAHRHIEPLRLLIAAGTDLNAMTHEGLTPIGMSIGMGGTEILRPLIHAGANVNPHLAPDYPPSPSAPSPLMSCIQDDDPSSLAIVVAAGAWLEERSPKEGQTAVALCARLGKEQCLAILLQAGADPEAVDQKGFYPIHLAAKSGHMNSIRILAEYGADLEATKSNGHGARDLARLWGHPDIAAYIQSEIDRRALHGNTPPSTLSSTPLRM